MIALSRSSVLRSAKLSRSLLVHRSGFMRALHSSMISRDPALLAQSPDAIKTELDFPGSLHAKFTNKLNIVDPSLINPLDIYRVVGVDGNQLDTSFDIDVDKPLAQKMYKDMVTISILDTIMFDAQRQGRLSFYMVNAGEEASAVGSASALKPEDNIFFQYREAGALLHRGFTLKEMMSQLYANKDDYGKGRNMPVHYASKKLNIHPISSPLATQLPHAAGAAYALKMRGQDAIVICYFGEGAASEGDFHAALNIAATRSCPMVFFCRNNGYAISTPSLEQYKGDGIASRGVGYGIDTIRVDGNDIFAVRRATQQARELALKDQKPVLIEAMSYRIAHHSTSDDSFAYRSKREVEDWKRKDNPITRMRKWLEIKGWWSEEAETELRASTRKEVLKAFSSAEKVKKPKIKNIFDDTYEELPEKLKAQRKELAEILDTYPDHYDLSHFENGREGLEEDK